MSARSRSLLVTGGFLALLFVGGLFGGYVYTHEPARDTLEVTVASPDGDGARTLSGTVTAVEGGRLTLATASGQVVVALPPTATVDELLRATQGLSDGTRVNVGVQSTQYGLVLTGLVAVEGAR